jgi:predicted nucleic acid-binding Zn ribbon protein
VKTTILAVFCSLSLAAFPAVAQDKKDEKKAPSVAQKKQQQRMKDCNESVGERKGDERKKYMSACLKGDTTAKGEKMSEQQSRMKDCNRQAGDKGMKGDERKKFMSTCLKN